jgi:hypothetical protein
MFYIGTPHTKGAGYFVNDNTVSGGTLEQADVKTCTHCQAVILMQQWRKVENGKMTGGFCVRCNAPICGQCNKRMATHGCEPFIAKIDREFDSIVKLAQFRKLAGLEEQPQQHNFISTEG